MYQLWESHFQPLLRLPSDLSKGWAARWGYDLVRCRRLILKLADCLALYFTPEGPLAGLYPDSDLGLLNRLVTYIRSSETDWERFLMLQANTASRHTQIID